MSECSCIGPIAIALVAQVRGHGLPADVARGEGLISSVRGTSTAVDVARAFLEWRDACRLPLHGPYLQSDVLQYLYERADDLGQSALDQHRQTLAKLFDVTLPRMESAVQRISTGKMFTAEQLALLSSAASDRTRLSMALAYDAGLRAHELWTLARQGEVPPTGERPWSANRFAGRHAYSVYTTTGKGGLAREVAISTDLAECLELVRRETPITITDRRVRYLSRYDLQGGQAVSQACTRAAAKVLPFRDRQGFHALRHTWAKRRYAELCDLFGPKEAALVLSQEAGHFRPSITWTYLGTRVIQ